MTPAALPVLQHATAVDRRAAPTRPPLTLLRGGQSTPLLRPAGPDDAAGVHALLEQFVGVGLLLPRSLAQVEAAIGDFIVAADGERIVGSVALRRYGADLGEVGALAVAADVQGAGVGRRLVEAAIAAARARGIRRVFALTAQVEFFHRLGFVTAEIAQFPDKLALDCATCARRAVCTEVAVSLAL